jgi:hypothetical protein
MEKLRSHFENHDIYVYPNFIERKIEFKNHSKSKFLMPWSDNIKKGKNIQPLLF